MKKFNAILSAILILLLIAHGIIGAILLLGLKDILIKPLARGLFSLVIIHTFIGIILTIKSFKVWKKTKTSYFKENVSFWLRRISGILIVILMCVHLILFKTLKSDIVLVNVIDLTIQVLFVCSLLIHVVTNIVPLIISFGGEISRKKIIIITSASCTILVFCAVSMMIYYLR